MRDNKCVPPSPLPLPLQTGYAIDILPALEASTSAYNRPVRTSRSSGRKSSSSRRSESSRNSSVGDSGSDSDDDADDDGSTGGICDTFGIERSPSGINSSTSAEVTKASTSSFTASSSAGRRGVFRDIAGRVVASSSTGIAAFNTTASFTTSSAAPDSDSKTTTSSHAPHLIKAADAVPDGMTEASSLLLSPSEERGLLSVLPPSWCPALRALQLREDVRLAQAASVEAAAALATALSFSTNNASSAATNSLFTPTALATLTEAALAADQAASVAARLARRASKLARRVRVPAIVPIRVTLTDSRLRVDSSREDSTSGDARSNLDAEATANSTSYPSASGTARGITASASTSSFYNVSGGEVFGGTGDVTSPTVLGGGGRLGQLSPTTRPGGHAADLLSLVLLAMQAKLAPGVHYSAGPPPQR